MPYKIIKSSDKYLVVKKDDGKVMGRHETKARAVSQLRAIHANERATHANEK